MAYPTLGLDCNPNFGFRPKTLVFDTEDTVISGEGNVDLRDEKIDLIALPVPKDFSPLSLCSYIRARGPF
jgi:hypothetical protein